MPMKLILTLSGRTLERYEFDKESVKIGRLVISAKVLTLAKQQ